MSCDEAIEKGKEVLNLKDKVKLQLAGFLLDRWCMATSTDGDEYFIKHIRSEKANVLYQIILGGSDWDGVYTLVFKKCPIAVDFEENGLIVDSEGNYDVALFKDSDTELQPLLICESVNESEFANNLISKNFIDEEELEIYRNPDGVIRPYLRKVLPRVKFVC